MPVRETKPGKTSPATWPFTSFSAPSSVSEFCARSARSTSRAAVRMRGGERHGLEELVDDGGRERVAHALEAGAGADDAAPARCAR